jgi:hypothetical protein
MPIVLFGVHLCSLAKDFVCLALATSLQLHLSMFKTLVVLMMRVAAISSLSLRDIQLQLYGSSQI